MIYTIPIYSPPESAPVAINWSQPSVAWFDPPSRIPTLNDQPSPVNRNDPRNRAIRATRRDGTYREFPCAVSAADFFGVRDGTIRNVIHDGVAWRGWKIEYADGRGRRRRTECYPVAATDPVSGNVRTYANVQQAAKRLGVSDSAIYLAIHSAPACWRGRVWSLVKQAAVG